MNRWTMKELDEITPLNFATYLVQEKKATLKNYYSPLAKKINEAIEALGLITEILEYVCDDKEYQDYLDWCLENEFKPEDIDDNLGHVYAKYLKATGQKFKFTNEEHKKDFE